MKWFMTIGSFVVAGGALVGCGVPSEPVAQNTTPSVQRGEGTDPTKGWVKVWGDDSSYKRCDGTTMLYRYYQSYGDGFTSVKDHPECAKNAPSASPSR